MTGSCDGSSGSGVASAALTPLRSPLPSRGGSAHPEHGQAGEVDRGGEEREVGVDLVGAADAGAASAVSAAHQVADLAFDLGAGGAVVGVPGGVGLAGAGVGEGLLVRADGDRASALAVVHWARSGQAAQAEPK